MWRAAEGNRAAFFCARPARREEEGAVEERKPFWESRTVWVGAVSLLFALLGAMGLLPEGLREEQVVDALMAAIGVLTIVFRTRASARLETAR